MRNLIFTSSQYSHFYCLYSFILYFFSAGNKIYVVAGTGSVCVLLICHKLKFLFLFLYCKREMWPDCIVLYINYGVYAPYVVSLYPHQSGKKKFKKMWQQKGEISFECVCWFYKRYLIWAPLLLLSVVKLFLFLFSPTSLCVGVFRNTFQTIQIHVKLHWSFTLDRLHPVTSVNVWDRDKDTERVCLHAVSLLCEEKKGSWQPLYTPAVLNRFSTPLSRTADCTFTIFSAINVQAFAASQIWRFVHLLVTYFPYIADSWWAQPPSKVALLWGVSFHGLQLWALPDTHYVA